MRISSISNMVRTTANISGMAWNGCKYSIGTYAFADPLGAHTFDSQIKKRVPPKRGTGPRRCVDTNPHMQTKTSTGPRASDEDQRNTPTPTSEAPKSSYVLPYTYREITSYRNWRKEILQGLRDVVYRLQKSEFERSRRLHVRL